MPLIPIRTLLTFCVAITSHASGQDAKPGNPLAPFEILIADEWKVTAQSGKSMYHRWHWGPGKHSIRRMTDGSGAGGDPWRETQVYYWHPGRKRVCQLGFSPYACGINEGTVTFDGKTADGVSDLHQTGRLRKMGLRWDFNGPDKYRETLLESNGPEGLKPLVEFDHIRVKPPAIPRPRTVDGAKLAANLKPFEPLLGHIWEANGIWNEKEPIEIRTTFEWVPLADVIYARTVTQNPTEESPHRIDTYFYTHTGAKSLRCLSLTSRGGVSEGDVTILDGGALQLDLKSYEGDKVTPRTARLDFGKDGSLQQRLWSHNGTERTLLLDLRHQKSTRKK